MVKVEEIKKRLLLTRDAMDRYARERAGELWRAAEMVVETYRGKGKVLIFGNGGSAAEAQHIAAELVNRMSIDRDPLPAVALTTDSSVVTSIANDYEFQQVFSKQVMGLGRPGDLAWGLSTSGTSPNVLLALEAAGRMGMKRLAFAGKPGAKIQEVTDLCLWVDADSTPVIQEVHLAAAHIICDITERELFGRGRNG
jgi:D-sedoheptulose 7-phosphate isomerase